ncbi:unnamed protein product [Mytilus coruscus]|uniref:Uncharacterized protein n=1 Tax=Mytilus coruscus TaxID=42192 RepID=A0A6J8DQE5_MYTCO|nr:unnamed protein product [Mytilus coruscus]
MPITYISNAYRFAVYAKVKGDSIFVARKENRISAIAHIAQIGVGGGRNKATDYDTGKLIAGFTRILPGQSTPFDPECKKRVYITIVTADERSVCQNHCLEKGHNVIVDNDAAMKTAKNKRFQRKYYKWIDKEGKLIELKPKRDDSDDDSILSFAFKAEDDNTSIPEKKSLRSQKSHGNLKDLDFLDEL